MKRALVLSSLVSSLGALAACGAQGAESTTGPVTVVAIQANDAGAVETVAPLPEGELGPATAKLWALEIAGKKDPALLSRVVATVTRGAERREMGLGEGAFGRFVGDHKLLAVLAKKTLLMANAETGAIVAAVETAGVDDLQPVVHTNLFVTTEGTALVFREAPSGRVVTRIEDASVFAAADDGSVIVAAVPDGLTVFDVKAKTTRTVKTGESASANIVLGDSNRVATLQTSGGSAVVTWDLGTGTEVARQPELFDLGPPAFSSDRKWIAMTTPLKEDSADWRPKKIQLVDRATKRVSATSGACPYPTSFEFSPDGKTLVVGDLLKACIFDIPSLRLVTKTAEVRKGGGVDDDLQNTTATFLKDTIHLSTADGSSALYTTAGKKLWSGRAQIIRIAGERRLATDDPAMEILSVEANNKIVHRPMTNDEQDRFSAMTLGEDVESPPEEKFQLIDPHVCRVGEWVLPPAACE